VRRSGAARACAFVGVCHRAAIMTRRVVRILAFVREIWIVRIGQIVRLVTFVRAIALHASSEPHVSKAFTEAGVIA
jgi:hypothetical protein